MARHRKQPNAHAEAAAREAAAAKPTWRPSEIRRKVAEVPLDELLYRFAVGDSAGAMAAAAGFLERDHVPVLQVGAGELRETLLDARARWLIPFIDGKSSLAHVLESCALPKTDALHAICELLDRRLVILR